MIPYTLTGPLPLAPGKTSPIFEFSPNGRDAMFLRAVALWTDNTALPGTKFTFQLRAPGGIFTDVETDGKPVVVTGEDDVTGTATCQPEDNAIFLVSVNIDSLFAPANSWHARIVNKANKDLRFVTVSSINAPATAQPWIVIGDPPQDIAPAGAAMLRFENDGDSEFLKVSNWGTGDLELFDEIGEPIGGEDSPLILVHRPKVVRPHGVDHMIIRRESVGLAADVSFQFSSSDERDDHGLLNVPAG